MAVRQVLDGRGESSYTLLDRCGVVVAPVEAFLSYLCDVERSPNTVRAYAGDLADWWGFLQDRGCEWTDADEEVVGQFIADLRWGSRAGAPPVVAGAPRQPLRSTATVSRKLATLNSFYRFHGRRLTQPRLGPDQPRPSSLEQYRPFLHHVTKNLPGDRALLSWRQERAAAPATLGRAQVGEVLAACTTLRDRLLVAVLYDTGLRIGEALGLRHEDLDPRRTTVTVVPRQNANGARAKSGGRVVPASASLMTLYNDYLDLEYGELDSDYVFVNLWGGVRGGPLLYGRVRELFARLAARTGVMLSPHVLRHTYATDLLRAGVTAVVVQRLLGHAHVTTTTKTYNHLDVEDLRSALAAAGVPAGRRLAPV